MEALGKVAAWLRRVSPRLRLRYDSTRRQFSVDQREYSSRWSTVFWIKGAPGPDIIHRLRYLKNSNFSHRGQLSKIAQERWMNRFEAARNARHERDRKDLREYVDQELRPKFAHAYGKSGWRQGPGYRLQDVKEFAAKRGVKM